MRMVCAWISSGYRSSLWPATGHSPATTANDVQCSAGYVRSAWQVELTAVERQQLLEGGVGAFSEAAQLVDGLRHVVLGDLEVGAGWLNSFCEAEASKSLEPRRIRVGFPRRRCNAPASPICRPTSR